MWSRGEKRELQRKMSYAYLASARTLLGELAALSWSSIPAAFTSSDPIAISTLLFVGVVAYCFFGGVLTQTYSYVDQLWSLLPLAYAWIFLMYGNPNPRVWLMAAIATAWGVRLTYNFARKGGYNGVEDYRWEVLRTKYITNRVAFEVFNFTFISIVQNLLIALFTAPIAFVWFTDAQNGGKFAWTVWDVVAAAGCLTFLVFETVADQQQWNFHAGKKDASKRLAALGNDYTNGFLTHGLFAYSRHPNFFGEQSFWVCFALFSWASTGVVSLNAAFLGVALLIFNFHFSTNFSEGISAEKYPAYKEYQASVSRLLPWFPASDKKSA